jgi:hypothetical protein
MDVIRENRKHRREREREREVERRPVATNFLALPVLG